MTGDPRTLDDALVESGAYTSNLLGTIRSHLQGLQGFDTMALELIQNADDAEAKEIVFDVRDEGLEVWNSGTFRYCGVLSEPDCPLQQREGYSCDFHRIADFGSGGKLSHSENIGRFGIGFSSTYQICDQPEIRSSGIHLTLLPEEQRWIKRDGQVTEGTTFFLPWALDPNSPGRVALGDSHVTEKHIGELLSDFQQVMRSSLLFLRHLHRAELRQHGELLLSVELERGDVDELILSFEPDGNLEQWLIVRAEADVSEIYRDYPLLRKLDRKRGVMVAIRLDPEPLDLGKLYAFLPTRQSTGMPLHLNADFFPEDSRKAIVLEGHKHQQEWNELLVETAASALAEKLTTLRDRIGHALLWELFSAALRVEQDKKSNYPQPLKSFWREFKSAVERGAEVGFSAKGEYLCPESLVISGIPLSDQQQSAFHQIGGELVNESLRPHRNALLQLGVELLTLKRFLAIASRSSLLNEAKDQPVSTAALTATYQPLWELVEELLPDEPPKTAPSQEPLRQLKRLPLIVDSLERVTSAESTLSPPVGITSLELASHFPLMRFVHQTLLPFSRLYGLLDRLTLRRVASTLNMQNQSGREALLDGIGSGEGGLQGFYRLLARIDDGGEADEIAYGILRELPIWKSGEGFSTLENLMLPGSFSDPTGQALLFDSTSLSQETSTFLEKRLGVRRQSIEEYVRTVVPRFFSGEGPQEVEPYRRLILALSDHAGLLDDDEICDLLSETPLVPSSDGGWGRANQLYYRTDQLAEVLGENRSLWIDEQRLPRERSVHALIESLGVLHAPSAAHLVDRILDIASGSPPDTKARAASEAAFYELCGLLKSSTVDETLRRILYKLVSVNSLPAIGDSDRWYMPEELYAPYSYQAFLSQAPVLDFKNTQRLNRDLLELLSISTSPETRLVVSHLLHCATHQEPVSTQVYTVLNGRAKDGDGELQRLKGEPCIYLTAEKRYIRPNQLYLIPQELGHYTYTVPRDLEQYRVFFERIGVKQQPEIKDYIDIVLEIVEKYFPQQSELSDVDQAVYLRCMEVLVDACESGVVSEEALESLREAPSVLNIPGLFCYPDDLLLLDSDWHAKLFGDDLQRMLCTVDPRGWSLYQQLGVRLLSQSASVELDYVDGQEKMEEELRERMVERAGLFLRMLHDEPSAVQSRLSEVLQNLSIVSHDEIRIVATININDAPFNSTPSPVQAFCDESMERIVVVRPINDRTWLHLYTVLLHRLIPQASTSHISQLSMILSTLVKMSVMDGEVYLTEANIPLLEEQEDSEEELDLRSQELGAIGDEGTLGDDTNTVGSPVDIGSDLEVGVGEGTTHHRERGRTDGMGHGKVSPLDGEGQTEKPSDGGTAVPGGPTTGGKTGGGTRKRGSNRRSWDQKLRSYVRQKMDGEGDKQGRAESDREHNLHIEVVTRGIVCDYERDRGRVPEEMSQTHAGYDIISRQEGSDDIDRFIEVKGRDGEWGKMGVSVSRTQFSNAQDFGDQYWLYVVEYALDDSAARVHPIQNPARKVDSFMFDGGWRDVAVDETADPALRFVEGATVDCGLLGTGVIEKVENRGFTKSLLVDFENGRKRLLPLNLKTMRVVDREDGQDHP